MYGGMALRTVSKQSKGAIQGELKKDTKNRSKGSLVCSVNEVKIKLHLGEVG